MDFIYFLNFFLLLNININFKTLFFVEDGKEQTSFFKPNSFFKKYGPKKFVFFYRNCLKNAKNITDIYRMFHKSIK